MFNNIYLAREVSERFQASTHMSLIRTLRMMELKAIFLHIRIEPPDGMPCTGRTLILPCKKKYSHKVTPFDFLCYFQLECIAEGRSYRLERPVRNTTAKPVIAMLAIVPPAAASPFKAI